MDGSIFPSRFFLMVLLLATMAQAGCSGNSSAIAADADDPPAGENPPVEDPPGNDPAGSDPGVTLSASDSEVASGDSVMLTWSADNVTSCSASGGWSGTKAIQGSATVGPISQSTTFTLTCTGDSGNAVAMLSISVLGLVTLEWQAPTENVDGTPLNDLAGYRIYYGQFSRSYTDEVSVADELSTQHEIELPSGSYYFAMTALDGQGNESAYSNEVVKLVN